MKLLTFFLLMLLTTDNKLRFDFGKEKGNTNDWFTLTDNVMGGVSTSKLTYADKSLKFSGNISFRNNGGFASLRANFGKYDLSAFSEVSIRFRAENQKFALTLENSKNWWEPNYKYEFQSDTNTEWKTVKFKLSEFHEEVIGRKTGASINKSVLKDICRIGIITNDKKEGTFAIEIDFIEFL